MKTNDYKKLKDVSTETLKQEIAKRAAMETVENKILQIINKVDFENADTVKAFGLFLQNQVDQYWETKKKDYVEKLRIQKKENEERRKQKKESQIDEQNNKETYQQERIVVEQRQAYKKKKGIEEQMQINDYIPQEQQADEGRRA